ncbi:hypothetical protein QJS10_CPB18g01586 [Acorus calamus]|uniref:Uncharacterized protein n=1 Tax=Acorus calamus TaxID=4465 RepID=A0AAV9CPN6_ACOCL|nr:hypothetical protein QJS10_CPB18g01586 [Acorus calamus]
MIAQLPWIQSPRVRNARKTTFIRVGDLSRCEPPSHLGAHPQLGPPPRIHPLQHLSIQSTHSRAATPPLPIPGTGRPSDLHRPLIHLPDNDEFWIVFARGNSVFSCSPRIGHWFSRYFEFEFISMVALRGENTLLCLLSDLSIARYEFDLSNDRGRSLRYSSAACSSVPQLSRATEYFLIDYNERLVLVVVVSYDLNWRPPAVVGFNTYFVDDIGPDAVRDHLLVLVNGGHSFSLPTPPGLRGTLAYLVPRPEFYDGTDLLWIQIWSAVCTVPKSRTRRTRPAVPPSALTTQRIEDPQRESNNARRSPISLAPTLT